MEKIVRRGKDIAAKIPYAQRVWGFLQPRQIPRPRGTEAFTPRIWDGQYARGDWAYMVDEHTRYAVIAWFTGQYLPPNGSLLDLGCGEGILTTAFVDLPYGRYVGVDFSKKALEFAAKRGNSRTTFFHSDITRYRPRQQFDIIVFNEVLYYLKEPG